MARVTVEDCVQVVNNRYELVLLAAQRARDIAAGAPLTVDRDNDKNPVIALREIAGQTINLDELRRHIARGVNRHTDLTSEDDELLSLTTQSMPQVDPNSYFGSGEITEVEFEEEVKEVAEEKEQEISDESQPEAHEESSFAMEDISNLDDVEKELTDEIDSAADENQEDDLNLSSAF